MAQIENDNGGVWEDPSSAGGGNNGGPGTWMKIKQRPEPYRVRLVSSPEIFRQHYAAFKPLNLKRQPISPSLRDDGTLAKDEDVAWNEGGWVPGKRYASLVIDRESGQIRILEGGAQIFTAFGNYRKTFGANPAGEGGPDWIISVGKDANGKTEYTTVADIRKGTVPFTAEEKVMIANCKIDLKKMYKRATPEEIRALWNQLPADKRINPDRKEPSAWGDKGKSQSQASQAPKQAVTASAPTVQAAVASATQAEQDDGDDVSDETFLAPKAQAPQVSQPVAQATPAPAQAEKPAPAVGAEKKAASLF
jgi:hypothetical protein